jgi:hypothetical protein
MRFVLSALIVASNYLRGRVCRPFRTTSNLPPVKS